MRRKFNQNQAGEIVTALALVGLGAMLLGTFAAGYLTLKPKPTAQTEAGPVVSVLKTSGNVIGDVDPGTHKPIMTQDAAQKWAVKRYGQGVSVRLTTAGTDIKTEGEGKIAKGNSVWQVVNTATNEIVALVQPDCANEAPNWRLDFNCDELILLLHESAIVPANLGSISSVTFGLHLLNPDTNQPLTRGYLIPVTAGPFGVGQRMTIPWPAEAKEILGKYPKVKIWITDLRYTLWSETTPRALIAPPDRILECMSIPTPTKTPTPTVTLTPTPTTTTVPTPTVTTTATPTVTGTPPYTPTPTVTVTGTPPATATPTPTVEACPFKAVREVRDENDHVLVDQRGFTWSTNFGNSGNWPETGPVRDKWCTSPLAQSYRNQTSWVKLGLPPGQGWTIISTFCENQTQYCDASVSGPIGGCPSGLGAAGPVQETINNLPLNCNLGYTFGWRVRRPSGSSSQIDFTVVGDGQCWYAWNNCGDTPNSSCQGLASTITSVSRSQSGVTLKNNGSTDVTVECQWNDCAGCGMLPSGGPQCTTQVGSKPQATLRAGCQLTCGHDSNGGVITGETCGPGVPTATPTTGAGVPTATPTPQCACPHSCMPGAGGCWWGSGPNICDSRCCSQGACPGTTAPTTTPTPACLTINVDCAAHPNDCCPDLDCLPGEATYGGWYCLPRPTATSTPIPTSTQGCYCPSSSCSGGCWWGTSGPNRCPDSACCLTVNQDCAAHPNDCCYGLDCLPGDPTYGGYYCQPPGGTGRSAAGPDLNGDGVVNLTDWTLAISPANYGKTIDIAGRKSIVNAATLSLIILSLPH